MATKTLSVELDVYERLKALKNTPSESFSQVLRRTLPGSRVLTGAELLRRIEDGTYPYSTDEGEDEVAELDRWFPPEPVEFE
jgi:predicted CopG family antitoxin